jgi:hypothetical protein
MPGVVPGIHVLGPDKRKAWMAGTSPAMTNEIQLRGTEGAETGGGPRPVGFFGLNVPA